MTLTEISLDTARSLVLNAQGLLHPPTTLADKPAVLTAIERMGALQIDTINVVARSPYFSLWSRLGEYSPAWLEELLAEGQIFEYWAHAACFLPAAQYPYHRRFMLERIRHHRYESWYLDHRPDSDAVLKHVQENGAVRSADFERKDGKKGTWWDWKIEKDALEYWLAAGEMMVARRQKFQRVYDLRQRVLPDWTDDRAASLDEALQFFVLQSVRSLGVAHPDWVADYFRLSKAQTAQALTALLQQGQVEEISVAGWQQPALIASEVKEQLSLDLQPTLTTLLPPFDSLIWDRKRTRQLFNYDFSIECYLPAAKRKYGYYLLTLLYRGRLVARLDAKAHRQEGRFEIKAFYWELGVVVDDEMSAEVQAAIQRCADWHLTPDVVYPAPSPFLHRE